MSIDADRIIAIRTDKIVYRDGNTVLKVFDPSYSTADIVNDIIGGAERILAAAPGLLAP